MRAIKRVDIDAELKNKLKQVLVLADLVKFAKEQPLPKENEDSFNTAVEFVKNTVKPKENNKPKDQSSPSATTQPQPTSPQP